MVLKIRACLPQRNGIHRLLSSKRRSRFPNESQDFVSVLQEATLHGQLFQIPVEVSLQDVLDPTTIVSVLPYLSQARRKSFFYIVYLLLSIVITYL